MRDDDGQGYLVGLSEEDMANDTIELIAGVMPGAVWCIGTAARSRL